MEVVDSRTSLWEVLAGRDPGKPVGPADPDLWRSVTDRLNPAKAKPLLRGGVEEVAFTSVRGQDYVMVRSPDDDAPGYLRLAPEEVELAHRMDGTRTVAALVGEFASVTGELAPDRVLRLVADLAGNRMLEELPVDSFHSLERYRAHRGSVPRRLARPLLATVSGQRMVLANPDRAVGWLYRRVGRLLFNRVSAVTLGLVALTGMVLFATTWLGGARSVFLVGDSYLTGAAVLLALNVVALSLHELGHSLAAKHAGRRVPAIGVLLYFGLPSVFVDTTDVWMAGRKARLLTSAAGPVGALAFAGTVQMVALAVPALGPIAFKIAFVWYLNSLFNLNPLMALDGYYLFMDWLEMPNLRPRAMAMVAGWVRRRRPRWSDLDGEGKMIAVYAFLALAWLVVMLNLMLRMWRDRIGGLVTGLWHSGLLARVVLVMVVAALLSPLFFVVGGFVARSWRRVAVRLEERNRAGDLPRRVDALRATALAILNEEHLSTLGEEARWLHPRTGTEVIGPGPPPTEALVVVEGALEGRSPGDPPGTIRARARVGDIVGAPPHNGGRTLAWTTAGTTLIALPVAVLLAILSEHLGGLTPEEGDEQRRRLAGPVWPASVLTGVPAASTKTGVHPSGAYPPLTPRPGDPPQGDEERERRFLGALFVLLLLVVLLALTTGTIAAREPTTWAEMSPVSVLLTVERGEVLANVGGVDVVLTENRRRYLRSGDEVTVGEQSTATLTFIGGGDALLCPFSEVVIGELEAIPTAPIQPIGALSLTTGVLVADTSSETLAFHPLALTVDVAGDQVVNQGEARFLVNRGRERVQVRGGTVTLNGAPQPVAEIQPVCPQGRGEPEPEPVATTSTTSTTTSTSTTSTTTSLPETTTTLPTATTTVPSTTTIPAPTTTTPPPTTVTTAPNTPPVITGVSASPDEIAPDHPGCPQAPVATISAVVADTEDPPPNLNVSFRYVLSTDPSVTSTVAMAPSGGVFSGQLGPFPLAQPYQGGGLFSIVVTAVDSRGATTTSDPITVVLHGCGPAG